MKANVRKTTADTLAVRGVALPFNSLNERDLRREAEAEKLIEEKHPGAMDILNMKVGIDDVKDGIEVADPYVERLIEATAFLSARVGLKLDAEYPRFTGHLLDVVYPNYLAPTPSMVVASCNPDLGDASLALGPTMPRGSGLRARHAAGQGTHCEFRTAQALRLWPLEVKRAHYFSYQPPSF